MIRGQMHEKIAFDIYSNETGNKVLECGVFLFPCGFLGSSPDSIIFSKRLAEEESKGFWKLNAPC